MVCCACFAVASLVIARFRLRLAILFGSVGGFARLRFFLGAWRCAPKILPRDKLAKKKGLGDKGPPTRTNPNKNETTAVGHKDQHHKRNHRQNQTRPWPPSPGCLLYLLGRFSAILPGVSYPVSYRKEGYPSRNANRAGCRCERNAISRPIPHSTHTTHDVNRGIGVTQILAPQSSL